jgi:hypothetical protein
MTDDNSSDDESVYEEAITDRDGAINEAFELLVDDDLDGLLVVTSTDGDLQSVSFTDLDENREQYADHDTCQLPPMSLLGGAIAETAIRLGLHPDDVADIGSHVTVDHLNVGSEMIAESWRDLYDLANSGELDETLD